MLVGDGFSKETGVFTAKTDGIYLVSGFIETGSLKMASTIEMKVSLNADVTRPSVFNAGDGISTVISNCTDSCVLHVSGAISLKEKETVAMFIKSNEISSIELKNSSTFSLLLVSEAFPLPNGMHAFLASPLVINVKGNKQIPGWQLLPSAGGFFGSTGDVNSFLIQRTGIFFLSINIKFRNLHGLVRAITSIANIPAITSITKSVSDSVFTMSVSGCIKMLSGSLYTITVYSETDVNYEILPGSSRSAVFLGTSPEGFTATQSETLTLSLSPSSVHHLIGWSTIGKDWLFESGSGFSDKRSFVAQTTGVYYVVSHVIISGAFNSTGAYVTLGVERDGFIMPEKGLYTMQLIKGTTTSTLVIAGNTYLEKWTQLKLVMKVSVALTIEVNIDSTFSIVKTSKLVIYFKIERNCI